MFEALKIDDSATHYEIILNRPNKKNALSPVMVKELHDLLVEITANPKKILLLRGEGGCFTSGHDLSSSSMFEDQSKLDEQLNLLQNITRMIINYPLPVIAAIDGYALGAGFEIALNCDLLYAEKGTIFGFPELSVGLSITQGSSFILPQVVGNAKARELIYFSKKISANEALNLGILNEVFNDKLLENVYERIEQLDKVNKIALGGIKKLFNHTHISALEENLSLETNVLKGLVASFKEEM